MRGQRTAFLLLTAVLLGYMRFEPFRAAAPALAPESKYVALTFDDGPRAGTTDRLLDGLRERGASATFFLIGEQIDACRSLVIRMGAEGHQVGNHSWDHTLLQGKTAAEVNSQISRTDAKVQKLLGPGSYWVRPPYGLIDNSQRSLFHTPLIHWSVDPEDWRLRNADAVTKAVVQSVRPGDIVLLHDAIPTSVDAALRIVDALSEQGYLFVTVEELLALYGGQAKPQVIYRSAQDYG